MAETGQISSSKVRIACIQMRPEIGAKANNIAASCRFIETAVAAGAQLIVLPELCNSGYVFKDIDEARSLAEPVPGGATCKAWSELAARLNVHIVAGINEQAGSQLYNSAVVIGPTGYLATYRKAHLWNKENLFFTPGDLGFPVIDTELGKLGVFICYDTWFSECYRLCTLQGADIICLPTNWVPIPGQDPEREAMANTLCIAAAHTNSVYVAAANRVGEERDQPFIGQSLIISYTGRPIGGPASVDREEVIYADCDPAEARAARNWNNHNNILHDRRTDLYDEMLGTHVEPGNY